MKSKVLVVLAVMAALVAFAGPAQAACTIAGHVVASSISGTTAVYNVAPFTTSGFIPVLYSFTTTNLGMMDQMNNALADNRAVQVTGSATVCPTTGTIRSGGTIITMFVRPLN